MSFSRRSFLKYGFAAAVTAAYALRIGAPIPALAADLPVAKESDPLAKSLKYTSDADKPGPNSSARKAADKKGQYCYNCQLFTKASGEKKGAMGKCMILPKNSVPGKAWCQSWVKNPAVNG